MEEPLDIDLDDWIVVPEWWRFQHYKDRRPQWIKVYVKLLNNPHYLGLSMASRGLLMTIWCAYAAQSGRICVRDVAQFCHRSATFPQLTSLYHAGFIEFSASEPLAPNKELERELERTTPPVENPTGKTPEQALLDRAFEIAASWKNGSATEFDERLDTLERELNLPNHLRPVQRYKLWDVAFKNVTKDIDW